jgi:hypothetical protein
LAYFENKISFGPISYSNLPKEIGKFLFRFIIRKGLAAKTARPKKDGVLFVTQILQSS